MFREKLLAAVLSVLKSKAVELVLAKVIGTTAGFKAWIAKIVVKYAFDEIAEPVIELAFRKGQLLVDKASGKITYHKIKGAKKDGNKADYIKHIGDV